MSHTVCCFQVRYLHTEYVGDDTVNVDASHDTGEEELLQMIVFTRLDINVGQQDLAQSAWPVTNMMTRIIISAK